MSQTVRVGIAQMDTCKSPDMISTIGLGSCIGIVLYDEGKQIAGLVHIMLPDSTKITNNQNKLKFADTGIDMMLFRLRQVGVDRSSLKAKIAGGAKMFSFTAGHDSGMGSIGDQNIFAVKKKLASYGIPIVAEDVGLDYGRSIIFNPATSALIVTGKHNKII